VRIYTLAKEMKIDSKELVDLCTRAGIHDKGSALASMSDEEVVKLKEFIAGKSRPADRPAAQSPAGASPAAARPAAPAARGTGAVRREDYIAPAGVAGRGRPAEIPTPSRPSPSAGGEAASAGGGAVPSGGGTAPSGGGTAPSGGGTAPSGGGTAGGGGRPLGRPAGPVGGRPSGDGPRPAPRPAFKLAPMPAAARPPVIRSTQEPAAQKPDVKLPLDAIRSAKAGGSKPLADHMRKHEQRQADAGRPRPGGGLAPRGGLRGGAGMAPVPPPMEPGVRPRRTPSKSTPGKAEDLLGGREARQLNRKRTSDSRGIGDDDEAGMRRRRSGRPRKGSSVSTAAPRKTNASIQVPCTVRAFSEAIGLPASEVLKKLLTFGTETMPSMGAMLDRDTVELLAAELGVQLDIKTAEDLEKELLSGFDAVDEDPALRSPRAPVVTFLGHVDHGKTSLLDRIIGIDVAAGESGGITQHIRAYTVRRNDKPITFVDTPGHEAFTQMRARGANVTDCAVVVVAADDGIMPQTEEAISHARAAGVPIVVCINKIDLPGADVQRIYQQLAANELLPTEWGGETEVVKTSALTGEGVDHLLDTLLTIAELHDLRANSSRTAAGVCLDASIHEGRGVVACLLVQKGTLRVGDAIVCGEATGHVKSMLGTLGKRRVAEAGPSEPVMVSGLDVPPNAGDRFQVVESIALAREVALKRSSIRRHSSLSNAPVHVTLENLLDRLGTQKTPTLNLILRADVRGSIEAILKELTKLEHPEVRIRVLQATVGGVSEADVQLADASDAVIIGFNVVPDERARGLAEELGVQVRRYDIIYQVTDDLRKALEGMLAPEKRETELGRAVVQRTYAISRIGVVAGCRVIGGVIARNGRLRVIRDGRIVGEYGIETLRREKDDAREVRDGLECGIKLAGFNDVKEGDILECFRIEEVARTLS
ncbi:MAG: translation initiation factor IF-2, partial [Planctomycetia bacterium]|nr:translation initiation factor IF-2 [Planctomycetia bacterium]